MKWVLGLLTASAIWSAGAISADAQTFCIDPGPDHADESCRYVPYNTNVETAYEASCRLGAIRFTSNRTIGNISDEIGHYTYRLFVNGETYSDQVDEFINRAMAQYYTVARLDRIACLYGDEFDLRLKFHLTRQYGHFGTVRPVTRPVSFSFLIYTITIKDGEVLYDEVREWISDDIGWPGQLVIAREFTREYGIDDLPLRPRAAEDAP